VARKPQLRKSKLDGAECAGIERNEAIGKGKQADYSGWQADNQYALMGETIISGSPLNQGDYKSHLL
jgi:hypothetical protein